MSNLEIPSSLQSVTRLGGPVRIYRQSGLNKAVNVVLCVVGVAIALALGYYGLVSYARIASPEVAQTNSPVIAGVAGLVLLLTLYGAWRVFLHWNETAIVYREGFAHFDGKVVCAFNWAEIASLVMQVTKMSYYGVIPAGTQRKYTLTNTTGDRFKLGDRLSKVEELVDQIREGMFPHVMMRSKELFDSGQPVQFGPISIDKTRGIQAGKRTYAWSDVAQVSVVDGAVRVKPKKRGLFSGISVPVASIPNVDVLLALIATMAEQNPETAKQD